MAKKKLDKGNLPTVVEPGNNPLAYKAEFDTIYGIISAHKKRAMYAVHNESLNMLWEVGAYVSDRLKKAAWGDGVVRMLADYIRTQSPKAKGWSYRTIYKMVQFYEMYSSDGFTQTVSRYGMQKYLADTQWKELPSKEGEIVPIESAQIRNDVIVPIELAQIPSVLFATGWSNHQLIMNRCKTNEQRLFYMLYAGREQLEYKELQRALKTDAMSSLLGSKEVQSEMMKREYPQSGVLFKDTDMEVVRYALNRSMSPTMVALYKEQLQVGGVIQRSLVEFCRFVSKRK